MLLVQLSSEKNQTSIILLGWTGGGGTAYGAFANKNWALGQSFDRFLLPGGLPGGMLAAGIDLHILIYSGVYAAFSAGGGGVHFKLERTSCQQSLKYISLYNTGGAPFSTEKRNIFLCT